MKRWLWLAALPWSVVATSGTDLPGYYKQYPSESAAYNGKALIVFQGDAIPPIEAIQDIVDSFNAAHKRRSSADIPFAYGAYSGNCYSPNGPVDCIEAPDNRLAPINPIPEEAYPQLNQKENQ